MKPDLFCNPSYFIANLLWMAGGFLMGVIVVIAFIARTIREWGDYDTCLQAASDKMERKTVLTDILLRKEVKK